LWAQSDVDSVVYAYPATSLITVDHTGNLVIDDKDARWTRRDAEVASDVSVDTMSHTVNGVAHATPFRRHSNADMARSGGCDADGLSLGAV